MITIQMKEIRYLVAKKEYESTLTTLTSEPKQTTEQQLNAILLEGKTLTTLTSEPKQTTEQQLNAILLKGNGK